MSEINRKKCCTLFSNYTHSIGIIDFLYEASDFEDNREDEFSKQTPEHIKKRFIDLANRLWETGISPSEF